MRSTNLLYLLSSTLRPIINFNCIQTRHKQPTSLRKQLISCLNIYFELLLGYWGEHCMICLIIYLLSQRPAITWSPMVVKAAYISSSTGLIWSSGRRKPYRPYTNSKSSWVNNKPVTINQDFEHGPWSLSSGAYEQGISAES